jgi:cytochrome c oxidase subunit 2
MDRFRLFPPQASSGASEVDLMFLGLILVSLFFVAAVFFPLAWFGIKYRRGSKASRANPSEGSNVIEVGWTMLPTIIGIALFSWGAVGYYHSEAPPADSLQVNVVGKQWMWKLQHAEGKREINELHVPRGRAVELTLTSQDVIHSFFVPAFRVKRDVIPGRYVSEWFKATRTGEYHIFCSQFCGTEHSQMIGRVVVMEPAAYQQWLVSGETNESVAQAGGRLFRERGCSGCHAINSVFHAPLLDGLYGRPVQLSTGETVTADDQYIRDSILLPGKQITAGFENIMPSYSGNLSEEEVMQLIAYLKSLGDQPPETEKAHAPLKK